MIKIAQYIKPNRICFLESKTREEALASLVDVAYTSGVITDKALFYEALLARERIVTTGIGMGVAIPHAKLPSLDAFFIVIGIVNQGIDWSSLDGITVRCILMIGGPDDKQREYLQILSALTGLLKDESRRRQLFAAKTTEDVFLLLRDV